MFALESTVRFNFFTSHKFPSLCWSEGCWEKRKPKPQPALFEMGCVQASINEYSLTLVLSFVTKSKA